MISANISTTKNELSRFLEAVRGGETVLILDRNRPIAQICPLSSEGEKAADSRLADLEAKGLLRRPDNGDSDWSRGLPEPVGNGPLGSIDALLDERRSGR